MEYTMSQSLKCSFQNGLNKVSGSEPIDIRSQLLQQFASLNEGRSHAETSFDMTSGRRLADPRLDAIVLDLLDRHRENEDTVIACQAVFYPSA
jgi:hypothetical protein